MPAEERQWGSQLPYCGCKAVQAACGAKPGALLKEAVDDLEWASGGQAVRLHMRRDPPATALSVHGAGDLKVTLPVRLHACARKANAQFSTCMQGSFDACWQPFAMHMPAPSEEAACAERVCAA